MRKTLLAAPILFLAGAAGAQTVTYQYGAGNGDPVQYPGPKPTYNYAYGPGNGDGVKAPGNPQTSFAYGGDGATGTMMQMGTPTPQPPQQAAAPAPQPRQQMAAPAPARTVRPGNHS